MNTWIQLKKEFYGQNRCCFVDGGVIDFSREGFKPFENEVESYDEFLEIQFRSLGKIRSFFERSYFEDPSPQLKGEIIKITSSYVLFKRIYLSGMSSDGTGFSGKEDHVWMPIKEFEQFKEGDSLKFTAEIYRYIKRGNGKYLDYGLRNPYDIQLISSYELPSDDLLLNEQIYELICATCTFQNHCFMGNCIADQEDIKRKFNLLKKQLST